MATIWYDGSTPTSRSKATRCRAEPTTNAAGTSTSSVVNGYHPVASTSVRETKAASDGHVAVGEVDDPHHAEAQREPGGEERVEPADEDAGRAR